MRLTVGFSSHFMLQCSLYLLKEIVLKVCSGQLCRLGSCANCLTKSICRGLIFYDTLFGGTSLEIIYGKELLICECDLCGHSSRVQCIREDCECCAIEDTF